MFCIILQLPVTTHRDMDSNKLDMDSNKLPFSYELSLGTVNIAGDVSVPFSSE